MRKEASFLDEMTGRSQRGAQEIWRAEEGGHPHRVHVAVKQTSLGNAPEDLEELCTLNRIRSSPKFERSSAKETTGRASSRGRLGLRCKGAGDAQEVKAWKQLRLGLPDTLPLPFSNPSDLVLCL